MAEAIKKNKNIDIIQIPTGQEEDTVEAKISMFADDTQLFHSTEKSIFEAFKTLELYCKASGAKLNLHKTKGLYIGCWKNKTHLFNKITWVKQVTGLGTQFGYNINYEEIWLQKFTKFKQKLSKWKNRDLTLNGKKMLINSYIFSSLSYLIEVYTSNISMSIIKKSKDLICNFLWGGNTWKIAEKNIALRKCHGGFEIKDLENLIMCKKIKWILRIHFCKLNTWNAFGKYCIKKYDHDFGIENFLLQCSNLKGFPLVLPNFYKTCLNAWASLLAKKSVSNEMEVLDQNIFGNLNITCKNQQSIFFKHWTQSKIIKIKDLWNSQTQAWKNGNEIFNALINKRNWIAEYRKIRMCISQDFKDILMDKNITKTSTMLMNTRSLCVNHQAIKIDDKIIEYHKLSEKELYFACLYPVTTPKCVSVWNNILSLDLSPTDILKQNFHILYHRKSFEFHMKTLHRALYTEKRLKHMLKSDGVCKLCKVENEDIMHLLVECTCIRKLWIKVHDVVWELTEGEVDIQDNPLLKLLGVKNENIGKLEKVLCNFIIFITKWVIWKHRNKVKHGDELNNEDQLFYDVTILCQDQLWLYEKSCNIDGKMKALLNVTKYLFQCDLS